MAAIIERGGLADTTGATSYTTGAFTPALNDLLVAIVALTGETNTDWAVSDSLGGSWTKVPNSRHLKNTSGDFIEVWIRNSLVPASSMTVTYSHGSGNATGCDIEVLGVSGMTLTGSSAVRSQGGQDNQTAAATPAPVLNQAALTGNPVLTALLIDKNLSAGPAGWTQQTDRTYSSPVGNLRTCTKDSGFTSATITWGANVPAGGTWCSVGIELDASTAVTASDSGTESESSSLVVAGTASDSGTESESSSLAASEVATDTGVLSESSLIGVLTSESAAEAEASSLAVAATAADSGALSEVAVVTVTLSRTDSGAMGESSGISSPVSASDSALLAEHAVVVAVDVLLIRPVKPPPPFTHAVEVELVDGRLIRYGPDERDADQVLLDGSFDTTLPGGFGAANVNFPRSAEWSSLDAPWLLNRPTRIYEAETNRTFYEGRIAQPSIGEQVVLTLEGFAKHLEDDKTAMMADQSNALADQLAATILDSFGPLLNYSSGPEGSIEPTSFVVPIVGWPTETIGAQMIEDLKYYGGGSFYPLVWGVYTGRQFFMRPWDSAKLGATWSVRRDQTAKPEFSGPSNVDLLNGVLVRYDDGTPAVPAPKTVGPVGSGADVESTDLTDTSPQNPANVDGVRHWDNIDVGLTSEDGAVAAGRVRLADAAQRVWVGDVEVQDYAKQNGIAIPAGLIRAGDRLVVEDDDDPADRRIASTSYTLSTRTVRASVGQPPARYDVVLGRLAAKVEKLLRAA